MSDGFPSVACADAILSHGEVVEAAGRFLASALLFCRGHKTVEVQTHLTQEPRALWIVMRVGRWIVVPGSDGERPGCSR
jgi:hypothetical protein